MLTGIIVTYNRMTALQETLRRSLEFGFDELYVINNASTDETKNLLDAQDSKSLVSIHLEKNIGGAGGFAVGLEAALEKNKSGWICLFDDDSFPITHRSVVDQQLAKYGDETGEVAAAVYLPSGEISEMNRVSINPFKSISVFLRSVFEGRSGFHLNDNFYYQLDDRPIDTSSFVGCFLRSNSLIQSGVRPRPELFIYADDILCTYELTEKGYKNFFCPQIKFTHDCGTLDQNLVFRPLWKNYYRYRNALLMYSRISKYFFPLVFVRCLIQWISRSKHYGPDRQAYRRILKIAVLDFFRKNYERSLPEIIQLSENGK